MTSRGPGPNDSYDFRRDALATLVFHPVKVISAVSNWNEGTGDLNTYHDDHLLPLNREQKPPRSARCDRRMDNIQCADQLLTIQSSGP